MNDEFDMVTEVSYLKGDTHDCLKVPASCGGSQLNMFWQQLEAFISFLSRTYLSERVFKCISRVFIGKKCPNGQKPFWTVLKAALFREDEMKIVTCYECFLPLLLIRNSNESCLRRTFSFHSNFQFRSTSLWRKIWIFPKNPHFSSIYPESTRACITIKIGDLGA